MQSLQLDGKVVVKRESSPLSDLELGIGCYGSLKSEIKEEADQILFTPAQIQELYIQVAIFRYLLFGLPVPIHLVRSIWNSVASSLGSGSSGIHGHFPSLAISFGFGDFDYRSLMDPEPGRCRRTDGKKWRCYKEVVPLQKYCEKHMHRGSNRSRKRVETPKDASKSKSPATNSYYYAPSVISSMATSSDERTGAEVSTSLDLSMPCPNSREKASGTLKDGSPCTSDGNWKSKGKSMARDNNGTNAGSLVRVLADKNITKYPSDYCSGEGVSDSDHIMTSKMDWSKNNKYSDASTTPGLGVPKSVQSKATVCTLLKLEYKTPEETELTRCKRSDGRKWRCKREVLPDKKYCEMHLCRKSRRARMVTGVPVHVPRSFPSGCTTPSAAENKMNLNTHLSISITASPQKISNGDSTSFSSSEATTVTDENVSIC